MKKNLIMCLLALAAVGVAQAQTKIYITGSSAFRSVANAQILTALGGSSVVVAQSNSSLGSANAIIARNAGNTIRVYASWTGSAAGVQSVAGNGATGTKTWFLTDLNNDNGVANHQVGDPNASSPNPDREQKTPDVAFSDTYQAATPFNGTFNGVTYEDLSGQDTIVGVVGFQWCASNNFPAGTRNMTPSLASYLLGSGAIPASFFTGNSGDNNALVYATGRNPDSGTRITTLAETGFGIGNAVNQYKPTITGSGATATVTSLVKYPLETINGVSTGSDGNSGESSGGTVRAYLNAAFNTSAAQTAGTTIGSTTVTAGYFITYLGASDANSTLSIGVKPAVPIAYNGINYWTAPNTYNTAAIGNGSYSFWCYEHVMIRATPGPGVATFATTLSNNILAQPTSSLGGNVALGDMYVQRASDGGQITSLLY